MLKKSIALIVLVLISVIALNIKEKPSKEDKEKPVELYKVINVIDGDTFEVQIKGNIDTVRLIGVDTPEVKGPYTEAECYGQEASEYVKKLLSGRSVRLEKDPTTEDRDKYDRLLRYVYLEDGIMLNELLIKEGLAELYWYFPFEYKDYFSILQSKAEKFEVGLWKACK